MELGIPVISTDVGSIAEHLKHGYNGCLVNESYEKPKLAEEFSKYVKSALSDKELNQRLSYNARKYAVDHFGLERIHKLLRKIFLYR